MSITKTNFLEKLSAKATILNVLLAFILFGGLGYIFGWWEKSIKRDDDYITKYVECSERVAQLNKQMLKLQHRVTLLEYGIEENLLSQE